MNWWMRGKLKNRGKKLGNHILQGVQNEERSCVSIKLNKEINRWI